MKVAKLARNALSAAGRWDIDFHLPPEGIRQFQGDTLVRVDAVADIATEKRDPTNDAEAIFQYIDIASVDVTTGSIANPQELTGEEAPSRARKVVSAFDVVVSTCRPTRGAIAVVPKHLHNQVASTAFTILRPQENVNPFYLHFALRLPSTLEQFRKWSTGSSYPAILDEDVKMTLIPMVSPREQDEIAARIMDAFNERTDAIGRANTAWETTLAALTGAVAAQSVDIAHGESDFSLATVARAKAELPPLNADERGRRARAPPNFQLDLPAAAE